MHKLARSIPSKLTRFCIEGNIACGKTSIISQLTGGCDYVENIADHVQLYRSTHPSQFHMIISPEPVEVWSNVAGMNLLDSMYKDPKRWSFTFESYAQLTRFNQMKAATEWAAHHSSSNLIQILERSIFSNRFCFIENFKRSKEIEPVEFEILDQCYEHLIVKPETNIDHFIYLQTSPDIVFERIQKRARSEEDTIPLEYLSRIHQLHELLFFDQIESPWAAFDCRAKLPTVSVVNANRPLMEVYDNVKLIIQNAH